jgi:hypothetical protein
MKMTKVVVVMALMSVMTTEVFAQTSSQNKSNEKPAPAQLTAAECKAYIQYMGTHTAKQMGLEPVDSFLLLDLFQNNNEPAFVVVPTDTIISGRNYVAGDSLGAYIIRTDMLRLFSYPIRSNAAEVAKAKATDRMLILAAARAHAVEELNEGRPRHRSEIVADLSDGTQVTIPTDGHDIYGWSIVGAGTYQMGENRYALGGELGIRYTTNLDRDGRWFIGAQVLGSLRKSYLNGNAVDAGSDYYTYGTAADLLLGRSFGKHHQFKVALVAGLNWEHYKTNSQARYYDDGSWDELQSSGNYLSSEFMLHLEYEGYNWPVSLFAEGGVREFVSVWQNEDGIRKFEPQFRLGVTVPVFRHWTNNR